MKIVFKSGKGGAAGRDKDENEIIINETHIVSHKKYLQNPYNGFEGDLPVTNSIDVLRINHVLKRQRKIQKIWVSE